MAKRQKTWVYRPPKPAKPAVPEEVKAEIEKQAQELVETSLKPAHLKPPPESKDWNYITDIYTKWYRSYFYFCAQYAVPGPNAVRPFFESKFARLEYVGDDCFDLAYMRHTEQWWQVGEGLSLEQCLAAIKDDPMFYP